MHTLSKANPLQLFQEGLAENRIQAPATNWRVLKRK
jgi:hypothetical protein